MFIPGSSKRLPAIAARPRCGDGLLDELLAWRAAGAHAICSLLTPAEVDELDLTAEPTAAASAQLQYLAVPIEDRQVPASAAQCESLLHRIESLLARGNHGIIHCRQGIARSGLTAACLLNRDGLAIDDAIERIRQARGASIPDTPGQLRWIRDHASVTQSPSRGRSS